MGSRLAKSRQQAPEEYPLQWAPAWFASPQPVWSDGLPLAADLPSDLHDVTLRQVVRVGYDGHQIRLLIINRYGAVPTSLDKIVVAPSVGGCRIDAARSKVVTFGGAETVTILPDAVVASDAVGLEVASGDSLAISIRLRDAPRLGGFHWDGRRTGYILQGDQLTAASPVSRATTERRLLLKAIYVACPAPLGVVAVLGDSITDGAGATLDRDARWPDFLAKAAARKGYAVVNAGISGARLLSDGMGEHVLARFDSDVASQPGICAVILLIGINDIAWPGTAFSPREAPMTFKRMIAGYAAVIARGHAANLRMIGGTLSPFADALPDTPMASTYYSLEKDLLRRRVNKWIRTSGAFDALVDFDRVLADPQSPRRLLPRFDSGDHLHPGDEGNRAMAAAVDLESFRGR